MPSLPCAPVVLMGYRRPTLTSQVFQAIRTAKPSTLFLVMDGPKPDEEDDERAVAEARAEVEHVDWECVVHRIYSETNLGLKRRVSTGLDEVFSLVDHAIILEDDCLPSADFFPYATELLARFQDDDSVGMISGSSRLRGQSVSDYSYDFSEDVRIWGWATWARVWNSFSASGDLDRHWSPTEQKAIADRFPPGARRKAMASMLHTERALDSWALPFVVHCVSHGYLNPVPRSNLVTNVGLGPSSTHTKFESWVAFREIEPLAFPLTHPPRVAANAELDRTESRLDAREFLRYPLRHPVDAARRVVRYLVLMVRRRGSG